MLRRLTSGLVFGLVIGGIVAFCLVRLGEIVFTGARGDALAYLSAAVAGVLTGAVAGKPIWSSGAKIEVGLKAVFGALMGVGAMFALRRWAVGFEPDLSAVGCGAHTPIGELPMASLPLISGALGAMFGLDNTDEPKKKETARALKRVATFDAKPGAESRAAEADDEDREPDAGRAKR